MAFNDEYREMVTDARDAVRKLLDDSTPDSWLKLRISYGELRRLLERDDRERELEHRAAQAAELAAEEKAGSEERARSRIESDEAEDLWRRTPRERRETLVFQVLGAEQLLIREITERMNAELGYPQKVGEYRVRALYGNEVTSLVKRLWRAGQLERLQETFNVNHTRYRYVRKHALDGPIAGLERAYHDPDAVA